MKRRVRVAGALAAMSMLAGLLPTMVAQPALAADTPVLTYAGPDTDRCTKRDAAVACPPVVRPAPTNNAVTAGDVFNVRFDAAVVPTAYRTSDQEHPFGYTGVMFTVRGFVDSLTNCYYSYSRSHLTTGRPYPLPSGLTVFAEATSQQVIGRVDGDLIYPETKTVQVSTSGKGGKYYCAITGIAVEYQQLPGSNMTPRDVDHVVSSPLRLAIQSPPTPGAVTALTPEIITESAEAPFTYRSNYTIAANVGGDTTNSRIASRLLYISTAEADGASCTGTSDNSPYYLNITVSGQWGTSMTRTSSRAAMLAAGCAPTSRWSPPTASSARARRRTRRSSSPRPNCRRSPLPSSMCQAC